MTNEPNHAVDHAPPRPLWAPWRMEYIRASKSGECFICAKAQGDDEAGHVIARGKKVFVLLNTFPYNSGHVLLTPYRHVADLALLDSDELGELMSLAVQAKEAMARALRPEGYNFGFNLGAVAGAGVADHLHGHLVPRWTGDTNFMPVIGSARVVPEALEATAALLREAWPHDRTSV